MTNNQSKKTLQSIIVTPESGATVYVGGRTQFIATGYYDDAPPEDISILVTWASSDPSIASIQSPGWAEGVAVGNVAISANMLTITSNQAPLTVSPPIIINIDVAPLEGAIEKGESLQFKANASYSDTSTSDITDSATWVSSDSSVASVVKGLATGLKAGNATITASSQGREGKGELTVTPALLLGINVTPHPYTLEQGSSQQYTAEGEYSDGTTTDITNSVVWSSSTPAVASINERTGLALAVAEGLALIRAEQEGLTGEASLMVIDTSHITLSVTNDNAVADGADTNTVQGVVTDINNNPLSGRLVNFTANNGAELAAPTATTGADGVVTMNLTSTVAGNSDVTATLLNGMDATVTVTFTENTDGATIEDGDMSVLTNGALADNTATNAVRVLVTDGNDHPLNGQLVIFTATNGATPSELTATTDPDGVVLMTLTSPTPGESVVTATLSNGQSASVTVIFEVAPVFTNITVRDHDFALDVGFPHAGFTRATFKINMSGVASDYIWSCNSSWIAVVNGQVTFIAQGNSAPVTITATPPGDGAPLIYTFSIKTWFVGNAELMSWAEASAWCAAQGGIQATVSDLTTDRMDDGSRDRPLRGIGPLWNEWGNPGYEPDEPIGGHSYWVSDVYDGKHCQVWLDYGTVNADDSWFGRGIYRLDL